MGDGRVWSKDRLLSGLLLAFCCWHAAFLIISIMPEPPAREGDRKSVLDLYRLVIAGRQQMKLFETIPVHHSLDLYLAGEDESGGKVIAGCVLPGFKEYPAPEETRFYLHFFRMMFSPEFSAYRDAYVRKAAQALAARRGPEAGRNWTLVVEAEYTRNLYHIRRDGEIAVLVKQAINLPAAGNSP